MHERIVELYERTAATWLEVRGTRLIEGEWIDAFTARLAPRARVLDIGCGGGRPVAAELIARGFAVTGIDSSSSLIGHARDALPAGEWIVGDMRAMDLGRRFDALIAWHSFFHLSPDDQRAMFPRFATHAEPGAPLMFTAGPEFGIRIGEWAGEPLYHASLSQAEYRALLDASGFDVERFVVGEPYADGPSVWIARRR